MAIGTLIRRLPDLRLADPSAEERWEGNSIFFRGLTTLPVRFTAIR